MFLIFQIRKSLLRENHFTQMINSKTLGLGLLALRCWKVQDAVAFSEDPGVRSDHSTGLVSPPTD